jgi:pyruvate dehydrogenase E2 component (dihydrolipoyllysine-residue acetyltransferase)
MNHEQQMPRLSDSMEEGILLEWRVAEGDPVTTGQELAEIETDKATMPLEAEADGIVIALLYDAGAVVPVGAPLIVIGEPGDTVAPAEATAAPAEAAAAPAAAAVALAGGGQAATLAPPRRDADRVPASPLARRVATALGVDLAAIAGSGPRGRVVRSDVETAAAPAGAPPALVPAPSADGALVELTRVQRTIARRMTESRSTVPDFELRADVDMTACVELRERLRARGTDPLPSPNDVIVKACAIALREFPNVNSAWEDGAVRRFARVSIGIAVAAPGVLLVPVLHDADRLSLREIAAASRAVASRARDGSATAADLSGATFTVSNLGMFGVDDFSAVIDAPQAAILAVGAVRRKPVVADDGTIVARSVARLALACDHRILYGSDGAQFLARVRALLEEPLEMLV